MKNTLLILLGLFFFSNVALTQLKKQVITPKAYAEWKHIEAPQISNSGTIISYIPTPQKGDQQLIIENRILHKKRTIARGYQATVSSNEKWVTFKIKNYYDSIRSLKIKKTPKKKWPKDTLGIYLPHQDSIIYFSKVESYKTAKEADGNWIGILRTQNFKQGAKRKKKKRKKAPKATGKTLSIYNPTIGTLKHIANIQEYTINENGDSFFWSKKLCFNDTFDSTYVYKYNTSNDSETLISSQRGTIKKLVSSPDADQLSYLFSSDTTNEKAYEIHYWNSTLEKAIPITKINEGILSDQLSVSAHYSPYFSENGNYLFFKIGKRPKVKQKDTLTTDEKYRLDLWSWTDDRIQPQQLSNLKRDQKKLIYLFFIPTINQR